MAAAYGQALAHDLWAPAPAARPGAKQKSTGSLRVAGSESDSEAAVTLATQT